MEKIYATLTNGKVDEIIAELKKYNFEIEKIDIKERERGSKFLYGCKFIWFQVTSSLKFYFRRLRELIKYRRLEPMLGGGGGLNLESFYGYIFNVFTAVVVPGIQFDLLKFIVVKIYKHLRSKKSDYVIIVSPVREPFDCIIKILIPNTLQEGDVNAVLEQGGKLYSNIDGIRRLFGSKEIIIKCIASYQWTIELIKR